MKVTVITSCLLIALWPLSAAAAAHSTDPNWPCEQIKVGELAVAAFWDGPAVDAAAADWRHAPEMAAIVDTLAQRRLPIDAAEQRIASFAQTLGANRSQVMTALFTGVFDALSQERATVISGLDRVGQRQRELAADLRQEQQKLQAAQSAATPDAASVTDLTRQMTWEMRVFDARRQSIRYGCNVPALIEQRLFRLAKAIRQQIE